MICNAIVICGRIASDICNSLFNSYQGLLCQPLSYLWHKFPQGFGTCNGIACETTIADFTRAMELKSEAANVYNCRGSAYNTLGAYLISPKPLNSSRQQSHIIRRWWTASIAQGLRSALNHEHRRQLSTCCCQGIINTCDDSKCMRKAFFIWRSTALSPRW